MSSHLKLTTTEDISIIEMDDGKVNVFSVETLENLRALLLQVPRNKGALVIKAEMAFFQAGSI